MRGLVLFLHACVLVHASFLQLPVQHAKASGRSSGSRVARAAAPHAVLAESESQAFEGRRAAACKEEVNSDVLGQVVSTGALEGLVVVKPESRELAKVGALLAFGGGATGVIVSERCGLYFAQALEGNVPAVDETATLLPRNLTVPAWDAAAGAAWGGVHDHLGVPLAEDAKPATEAAAAASTVDVFGEPVAAARRRPIGASLHSGVVAIDALTPIGRGQSMMLFGPDGLPAGCGRTDLALRLVSAQHALQTDVKTVLVLAGTEAERASTLATLRESGALEHTKVHPS